MKVPPTGTVNRYEDFDRTYTDEQYQHFLDGTAPHIPTNNGTNEEYANEPPAVDDSDFSEYMWMENEEEFDKEVLQRLEEEELMEQCMLQHMLDNERPSNQQGAQNNVPPKSEPAEMAKSSTLNPHAAEFIPSWDRSAEATDQKS